MSKEYVAELACHPVSSGANEQERERETELISVSVRCLPIALEEVGEFI